MTKSYVQIFIFCISMPQWLLFFKKIYTTKPDQTNTYFQHYIIMLKNMSRISSRGWLRWLNKDDQIKKTVNITWEDCKRHFFTLTRKWLNIIWYSSECYSIFVSRLNTSTLNHNFFAAPTIRLKLQRFAIRFVDESWSKTLLVWVKVDYNFDKPKSLSVRDWFKAHF